jgi:hypothetical protein
VLAEEKLIEIGARVEHTPRKSLKRLVLETGVSVSSARRATQLLKRIPCKTPVTHARLAAARSSQQGSFFSRFRQSVVEGEIDPQLMFFSDEAWFHLQRCENTQNNRYRSSQNPHITHEVSLQPVKVCVWYTVNARRIVGAVF